MLRSRRRLPSMRHSSRLGVHIPNCFCASQLTLVTLGTIIGFAVTMCVQSLSSQPLPSERRCSNRGRVTDTANSNAFHVRKRESEREETFVEPSAAFQRSEQNSLVFAGIMTAQKYVDSRAWTIWRSWAQTFPGTVMFFVAQDTFSEHPELPLIRLPGVDDSYPPQRKSFMMLKWMADHALDQYEWFLRADDDVYVRGDKLELLLRSLNSSQPYFLGQAGLGTPEEYGTLNLGEAENYCMGGPGVTLSRRTLQLIRPKIPYCLENMYTTHEDVEVGRCVKKFAGVACSWSYEMQTIFYNNQSGLRAYTGDLNVAEVHQAISMHPVKLPDIMMRLHNFVRKLKTADLRFRSIQLSRDVLTNAEELSRLAGRPFQETVSNIALPASLLRFIPSTHEEIISWDFLSPNILYCAAAPNCPRHNAGSYLRYAISDVVRQLMDIMNRQSRQRGRVLQFQNVLYGYHRVDPLHGAEYILDVLLLYKKFKGRRVTVPVRRHAYIQQSFASLEIESIDEKIKPAQNSDKSRPERIDIVLPLAGRSQAFRRFINHFEETCLRSPNRQDDVLLTIVLFDSASPDEDHFLLNSLQSLKTRYPAAIRWLHVPNSPFSRGLALAKGAADLPNDSLLFFTDIDVLFNRDVLHRIRLNTVKGRQVNFPIVFSQFDPSTWANNSEPFGPTRGYFRHFGFGLVSLYKSDLNQVGGMETGIQGWGLEDVNLFEKFLHNSTLSIFRAPDPELVHVFHPVLCDKSLPPTQFDMCLGSRYANYASVDNMADRVVPGGQNPRNMPPLLKDGA